MSFTTQPAADYRGKAIKCPKEIAKNFQIFPKGRMNEPLRFPKAVESTPVRLVYEFGPFRVDRSKRLLLQDGKPVSLAPTRLFETLLVLIEHKGQVVEKDTLMRRLWPDTVVEESNLTVNVSALRKRSGKPRASTDTSSLLQDAVIDSWPR